MPDFDQPVYCLAGLPFDAVTMPEALELVRDAAAEGAPCFVSTPNLNFLISCLRDDAFRNSVIHSDLSIADGMPLVWIAGLLGVPIRERVTGSGLFETLWRNKAADRPLSVYFFGGPEGVAERASQVLNAEPSGMRCVGFECPGFGSVEAMSSDETIARINASNADFLVVALGARKGQAWIEHNRARIAVPVISHLGAVVNFVAGTVSRAPLWMQRSGLEWLWRIKEEPALWKRYWHDGTALLGLLVKRVLPYALWLRRHRGEARAPFLLQLLPEKDGSLRLVVEGGAPDDLAADFRSVFRAAAAAKVPLVIDFARVTHLSPAFFGLMLMLKKQLDSNGLTLRCVSVAPQLRRIFFWNGVDYLLQPRG